jgi:hypothetical protein
VFSSNEEKRFKRIKNIDQKNQTHLFHTDAESAKRFLKSEKSTSIPHAGNTAGCPEMKSRAVNPVHNEDSRSSSAQPDTCTLFKHWT